MMVQVKACSVRTNLLFSELEEFAAALSVRRHFCVRLDVWF